VDYSEWKVAPKIKGRLRVCSRQASQYRILPRMGVGTALIDTVKIRKSAGGPKVINATNTRQKGGTLHQNPWGREICT